MSGSARRSKAQRRTTSASASASAGSSGSASDEVASASEPGSESEAEPRERRSLKDLVRSLGADDPEERRRAARSLGAAGPKAHKATPMLAAALGDADEQVRLAAAQALGKIGPAASAAVPALIDALEDGAKDRSRDGRTPAGAAASALKKIGPAAAPDLFRALLRKPIRRRVARVLRALPLDTGSEVTQAFGALLAGTRAGAPLAGLEAVAAHREQAIPLLIQALGAVREEVAGRAGDALVGLGRDAVGPLAEALRTRPVGIRLGATQALRRVAREVSQRAVARVVPDVTRVAAEDSDAEVRGAAIEALGALTEHGDAALPGLMRALGDDDARNGLKAVTAILDLDVDREALVGRLADVVAGSRRPFARLGACMVLMHLGPLAKPAAPVLVKALDDAAPEVREYAHLALQSIRTPSMRLQVIRTASLRLKAVVEESGTGPAPKPKAPARRRKPRAPRTRGRRR